MKLEAKATPGPSGSHSRVSNHVTANTISTILAVGSHRWYLSSAKRVAPFSKPKAISAMPAHGINAMAINSPPITKRPFQTILIVRFLMVMEKNQWAKGGSRAITIMMEATSAKVLVKASGLNSFPSAATMVKTGRKLTMVMVMAVTMAWATSLEAR